MKKILSVMIALFLFAAVMFIAGEAQAEEYYVDVTTNSVVGSTAAFAGGGYPNISGSVEIHKIILWNDVSASASISTNTISVYENATSTSAASLLFTAMIYSTTTANNGSQTIDFPSFLPLEGKNIAITKDTLNTNVKCFILFR